MEQYVVSARKYRPSDFSTLIGQDSIATTLVNSIKRGQVSHSYLFCGPRGVGKTTTARIFAKMLNCENPSADCEPCGKCESCLSFAENRSFCIHELDAASNNSVEDIKTLLDKVLLPPQVGRYSVYIIDEVHMLSTAAFNAFLKTLEEPPAHAIFILATTEKHKIPATILSRCQTYDFNRISIDGIVKNLTDIAAKEGITIDQESKHVIARKADGAMRDALTIFDQCVAFCGNNVTYEQVIQNLNFLDYSYSFKFTDLFLSGNYRDAFVMFNDILAKGFSAVMFVSSLTEHFRNLSVAKAGGADSLLEVPDSVKSRYYEQCARCDMRFIFEALKATQECEATYRGSINPRLLIEFMLMKLCYIVNTPSVTIAPQDPSVVALPQAAQATAPSDAVVAPQDVAPTDVAAPRHSDAEPEGRSEESQLRQKRKTRAERQSELAGVTENILSADADASQLEAEKEGEAQPDDAQVAKKQIEKPTKERIFASWQALSEKYKDKAQLYSVIAAKEPVVQYTDGDEISVAFDVYNVSQYDWFYNTKKVEAFEKFLCENLGYDYIKVSPSLVQAKQVEAAPYLPSEKARDLIEKNDNVRELVKALNLSVK